MYVLVIYKETLPDYTIEIGNLSVWKYRRAVDSEFIVDPRDL